MSVICRTFVQNAWRSDLCSNCFKSLEDHTDGTTARRNNVCEKLSVPRYVPQAASLYQSRGISTSLKWRLNESLYERVARRDFASQTPQTTKMSNSSSIQQQQSEPPPQTTQPTNRGILIKCDSSEKKYRSRPSVDFASEEALVIGYGGNDYDSDTSPWEMGSDDGSIDLDLLDDTDEDRKITKMTKNNTEFNSFNKNLISGDTTPRVKKEEEKLNTINNNVSNTVKNSDKSINILTYNDIQSTKTEKKLNQYFFPSSTEIKSFLNGHGKSPVIEDIMLKNNKEKSQLNSNVKVQNCKRETEKRENTTNSKVTLADEFTPLNTRTYSFVSELNKNNVSFEQSSDSDYSTCRHTTGDSTDSESFHDAEESRPLPKSSFLHGSFAVSSPQMNESDIDKKYDAGSSTSGDISNFSDDSDTHDTSDRTPYKLRNTKTSATSVSVESKHLRQDDEQKVSSFQRDEKRVAHKPIKEEEPKTHVLQKDDYNVQLKLQKDSSLNVQNKQQNPSKNSPKSKSSPAAKCDNASLVTVNKDLRNTSLNEIKASPTKSSNTESDFPKVIPVENEKAKIFTKSASLPNVPPPPPDVIDVKRYSSSTKKESPKQEIKSENHASKSKQIKTENSANNSCGKLEETPFEEMEFNGESHSPKISEDNLTQNDDSKEVLRDKEFKEYEDQSDGERSPEAINKRQSKLAALALELELARRDSESKANKLMSPSLAPVPPPEVKVRCTVPSPQVSPTSPSENYPTIKKASAISCASRLSTLPDVLQETPAKQKKNKFSLKKLLKRNKESATFSPAEKVVNPKAWKKQTFDRNRLSLEIVHPMDLTNDVPTSGDSTPTEEHKQIVCTHPGKFMFKGVSSRARSLSALPQLSSIDDQSGCALLECRKMDTVPMRKAGTVAERKKNRPALVRTPSCSALPNRSTSSGSSSTQSDRAPPPKPPPPPKCKVMHPPPPPPPPHSHPKAIKTNVTSPARPPPPKVPELKSRSHSSGSSAQELHEQNHSDKEYANLGDIRSLLTPKKPQRPSAFSATPGRDSEIGSPRTKSEDSTTLIYETLPPTAEEEEDHYTYLDEAEVKITKQRETKGAETASKAKSSGSEPVPCGRPWLDLQTSYAAIAAANYESLAELITTSLNESAEYFKKVEHNLKWRDFILESGNQFQSIKEKAVYNAIYRNQDKVTMVVSPRKHTTPQNARNQTRYPVLASFNDHIPKNVVSPNNYILQESELTSIYILQQSTVTTVNDFAKTSSDDLANQYIHLRNYCFVLLQLIHTLKSLQAEGIEEINYDLQILILVVTDAEKPPILVLFPEDKIHLTLCDLSNRKTLCQATLETMLHFLQINDIEDLKDCIVNGEQLAEPVAHTFRAIAKVLSEEKASSLSQAKGLLEYMLWGPVDVKISQNDSVDILDTILQRWLDLQRAQMVKSTISYLQARRNLNTGLHVYEEYQLIFLLQASVKSLKNVISKL